MEAIGLTALKKDENGNDLRKIDWEHTYAVAPRGNHIYLNIKTYASYMVFLLLSISIWNLKIKTVPHTKKGPPPQGRRRTFFSYNHCLRITVASNSAPS